MYEQFGSGSLPFNCVTCVLDQFDGFMKERFAKRQSRVRLSGENHPAYHPLALYADAKYGVTQGSMLVQEGIQCGKVILGVT